MNNYPKSRQSNLVVQEMENELLIYDLNINKAFCLNETSAMVWQLCDGKNSVADIAGFLSRKLKMNVPDELVQLALEGLKKDKLLEESTEFEIDFGGLNRREVIRKIGLSSMIMLPIISSVVAPSAAMAQSGAVNLPLLSVCTGNSQCQSGFCSPISTGGTVCCTGSGSKLAPGNILGPASVCSNPTFTSQCCSGVGALQPTIPVPGIPVPLLNCVCG